MKNHIFTKKYKKVVNGLDQVIVNPKKTPLHKHKLKNPLNY